MQIFSRPLQTAMSSLCALCHPLPLSFVDSDDEYDDLTLGLSFAIAYVVTSVALYPGLVYGCSRPTHPYSKRSSEQC